MYRFLYGDDNEEKEREEQREQQRTNLIGRKCTSLYVHIQPVIKIRVLSNLIIGYLVEENETFCDQTFRIIHNLGDCGIYHPEWKYATLVSNWCKKNPGWAHLISSLTIGILREETTPQELIRYRNQKSS